MSDEPTAGGNTWPLPPPAPPGMAPPPPAGGYAMPAPVRPKTSGLAVAALVVGLVGWMFCGVGSVVAIALGAIALGTIAKSEGALTGRGMAVAGLVLGIIGVVATAAFWVLVVRTADTVNDGITTAFCRAEKQVIEQEVQRFRDREGRSPRDVDDLVDNGYTDYTSDRFEIRDGGVVGVGDCRGA
jgi:hypothetical protein